MSDCACEICGGDHEVHFVRPAPAETPCDCEGYQACAKCAPHLPALPSFPGYPQAGSKPLAIESFPGQIENLRREITTLKGLIEAGRAAHNEDRVRADTLGRENARLREGTIQMAIWSSGEKLLMQPVEMMDVVGPDRHDFYRANGDCLCPVCGKKYYAHPHYFGMRSYDGSYPLRHLCNGDVVKL